MRSPRFGRRSQALDLLLERPQVPVRAKCVGLRVDAETVRAVRNVDDYDGVEVPCGRQVQFSSATVDHFELRVQTTLAHLL